MPRTPTGRIAAEWRPRLQRLPFPWKGTAAQYIIQARAAETYARLEAALNEREDECIRMFGGDVTYVLDERIIHHG
jgi:hypothetical protein